MTPICVSGDATIRGSGARAALPAADRCCFSSRMTAPILFDLDGVLLDTEPLYTEASQRVVVFPRQNVRLVPPLKAEVMGRPDCGQSRVIVERLALPLTPEEYLARRVQELLPLFERVPEVPE